MRILRLTRELERVTDPQIAPYLGGGVMAKSRKGRTLHQHPHACPPLLRADSGGGNEACRGERYSPNASRIHSMREGSPSTSNTSKRHAASGRRVR